MTSEHEGGAQDYEGQQQSGYEGQQQSGEPITKVGREVLEDLASGQAVDVSRLQYESVKTEQPDVALVRAAIMSETIVFCTLALLGGALFLLVAVTGIDWFYPTIFYIVVVFVAFQRYFGAAELGGGEQQRNGATVPHGEVRARLIGPQEESLIEEAAERLGVSKDTVRRRMERGTLQYVYEIDAQGLIMSPRIDKVE